MGRADRIEAEFPPGVTMPLELRRLCDFLDRTDYPISGNMRLRPEGEGLKGWFGDGTAAWCQLAGFGSGPDGSLLALWLYAGSDTSTAPVVHIGSEGDHMTVLADHFREFLELFGIGYNELGFDDLSKPPQEPESAERLREWLVDEFGIHCPETGSALVQRARSRHPEFDQWVQAATEATVTRDQPEAEGLRIRACVIVETMIRDRLPQTPRPASWWSIGFKIARHGDDLSISFRGAGEGNLVPAKYKLAEVVAGLLKFVRHKDRQEYELSVCRPGFVTVGPNRELVLEPPADDA